MINNIGKRKFFLEYREIYLQVVVSALKLYAKTKDKKIMESVKSLGRIYKDIEKEYRS